MSPTKVPSLDTTMGSALIGAIVSAVLLGLTYMQTYYYFMHYPTDRWHLKSLVACTAVFDTAHQLLISHALYHYLITNYNNPPALDLLIWSVLIEALFSTMTSLLVQCFYTLRVWRLCRNRWLTGSILLLVAANAAGGITWIALSLKMRVYEELVSITPLIIAINAFTSSADVLIAASLVIFLCRSRTGFAKSDSTINRLILFIVNTGVLTSIMAVAVLIAIAASPTTLIYSPFYFCIGRFYANSFLATLNARKHFTRKIDDVSHRLVFMPPPSVVSPPKEKETQNISVRIDTHTTQELDGEEASYKNRDLEKSCDNLSDGTDSKPQM